MSTSSQRNVLPDHENVRRARSRQLKMLALPVCLIAAVLLLAPAAQAKEVLYSKTLIAAETMLPQCADLPAGSCAYPLFIGAHSPRMKGRPEKGLPPALSNLPGARFNTAFSFSQTDPDLCQLEILAGDLSRAAIWVAQQTTGTAWLQRVEGAAKACQVHYSPSIRMGANQDLIWLRDDLGVTIVGWRWCSTTAGEVKSCTLHLTPRRRGCGVKEGLEITVAGLLPRASEVLLDDLAASVTRLAAKLRIPVALEHCLTDGQFVDVAGFVPDH